MWPVEPRHKLKLSVNMIRKCSCREERHVFPSTHFLQALHRQRPRQQLRLPDEDKSKPLSPSRHDELLIKCKRGPSQPFVPVAATKFRMSWCFSKWVNCLILNIWCISMMYWCFYSNDRLIPSLMSWWAFRCFCSYLYFTQHCWSTASCSAQPSSSQWPGYCWSHSYYSGSKYCSIWWL